MCPILFLYLVISLFILFSPPLSFLFLSSSIPSPVLSSPLFSPHHLSSSISALSPPPPLSSSCSPAGVPPPEVVWYKDAVPISPVKYPRYRVLVGGSLQVNGLLPDDTGMFQCFARNSAGEVQTNTYLAVTSE